jgi:uncharacterized protein YjiS (DUF1127 family)
MTSSNLIPAGRLGLAHRMSASMLLALRMIAAFLRAIGHRREIGRLLEFDDRALHDIGLARTEVLGALAQPWTRDPSAVLLVRSIERRAHSRALDVAAASSKRPVCRV